MILGSCKVSHQQTVKFCGTSFRFNFMCGYVRRTIANFFFLSFFSCDRIIRVFSFMINCPSSKRWFHRCRRPFQCMREHWFCFAKRSAPKKKKWFWKSIAGTIARETFFRFFFILYLIL